MEVIGEFSGLFGVNLAFAAEHFGDDGAGAEDRRQVGLFELALVH